MSESATRRPVLSRDDHERFLSRGYVVLRRALDEGVVRRALQLVGAPGFDFTAPGFDMAHQAIMACTGGVVREAVEELFGPRYEPRPRFSDHHPRVYQPDAPRLAQQFHLDDDYPTFRPAHWALSSFAFLTPVKPGGGALVFADGSPLRYRRLLSRTLDFFNGNRDLGELGEDDEELLVEPGDALLVQHLLGHAGTNNRTDAENVRHALLFRWYPDRRLDPGSLPFDEMSTLERANSARYLAQGFGVAFEFPRPPERDRAGVLAGGLALAGGVRAQDVLHVRGRTHLLAVDGDGMLRHYRSGDLVGWSGGEPVAGAIPEGGRAVSVSHLQCGDETSLVTALADGRLVVSRSDDLERWTVLDTVDEARGGWLHYNGEGDASRVAWGRVLYRVRADGSGVDCPAGGVGVGAPRRWVPFVAAPRGLRVVDGTLASLATEERFGLVVDVVEGGAEGAEGAPRPYFAVLEDAAVGTELRPLPHDAPEPPRNLRVLARAYQYWIVSYLRRVEGRERYFWGVLDWIEEGGPCLRELRDAEALRRALAVAGIEG